MQFNQVNKNLGDVYNAISEKGNVVQTTGAASTGDVTSACCEKGSVVQTSRTCNEVQVGQGSESFWGILWNKVKVWWKWIAG